MDSIQLGHWDPHWPEQANIALGLCSDSFLAGLQSDQLEQIGDQPFNL